MMTRAERKLAAILAADVVGYSRLMAEDEVGTHTRLKACLKELVEPRITEYHGRIVKLTGDGALVEFASAVDAVECAVAIQKGMAGREAELPEEQRLSLRIGINIGDIILEDGDIYGDGVNVAARLETLAEPGGICIARNVWNQVKAKLDLVFEPTGEHRVKNIAEPIAVYRVRLNGAPVRRQSRPALPRRWAALAATIALLVAAGATGGWYVFWGHGGAPTAPMAAEEDEQPALPLPDRPSIAVLPFDNLSGETRWERLADGITEDIITDLSRFRDLFVIARNSTAVYKGQPTDVRRIGRELGVHYILEGSLQIEGDRVRVTTQLIDAASGHHVWSERYDRPLDDVFAVQDEVTRQVVGTLGGYWGRLAQAGREVARRQAPESLQAYDYYLLGIDHKHQFTEEDNRKARAFLSRSIALDPEFARAYVGLAWTHEIDLFLGFSDDPGRSIEDLLTAARAAVTLDDADAEAHLVLGVAHLYAGEIERGAARFERALELGSNNADILATASWTAPTRFGATEEDVERVKRAKRLNPHYPDWYLYALGFAAYHARQYDEAVSALQRAASHTLESRVHLALSLAELGREAEMASEITEVLDLEPDFTAEWYASINAFVDPAVIAHFLDSARTAGLPVCASETQLETYSGVEPLPLCEAERAQS